MKQLLTEIFQTYYADVYTYLYSLCRDASLAEDLSSEVFLSVVKSIPSFRGDADIKTWLFTIARRKWFDYLRKRERQIPTESIHGLHEAVHPESRSGEREMLCLIRQILQTESEMTLQIVQMRLDGYSYYEIAAKHQISENSARVVFFRAKSKIKKQLEKEGFTL